MNTNSVSLWDFRSLHKQIFSNCMRKLSGIIDCFWFLHSVFPFHSIHEIFTETTTNKWPYSFDSIICIHQFSIRQLRNLFIVFLKCLQFPKAQHLQIKVVPQCVDLATNCECKFFFFLLFRL